MTKQTGAMGPFITLISIFFFWGFVAASNEILIPVFKKALDLTQMQAQMISFAFYVAYTVGSLIYFIGSLVLQEDILSKLGYRNGLALGLLISASGTLLFIPAANNASFPLLLSGLFVVGLGFSLQQTAANPLAIVMGDKKQASQRLSLAGGINNVGTTIGPLIIAYAIFGSASAPETEINLETVKTPYLVLGAVFVVAAILFKYSSVPNQIDTGKSSTEKIDLGKLFSYPQLTLGMLAIFLYVGVEVSTVSNLPEFMKQKIGASEKDVAPYVSLFWGSLMIDRWTTAGGAFNISASLKRILNILLPFIAFVIFLGCNSALGHDVSQFYFYAAFIPIVIIADFLSKGNPSRQLLIYSLGGIIALLVGIFSSGYTAVYAFITVGLFCSTLWPCVFTLGISGLGKYTNEGSSLLIMMIMGGGVVSLTQGFFAKDAMLGIQNSYFVGVVCFIYLAFYAFKTRNLDTSGVEVSGH